jgi:hypothetical protein
VRFLRLANCGRGVVTDALERVRTKSALTSQIPINRAKPDQVPGRAIS